jgi:hypothetical protein
MLYAVVSTSGFHNTLTFNDDFERNGVLFLFYSIGSGLEFLVLHATMPDWDG